jgi:hypothetical protein
VLDLSALKLFEAPGFSGQYDTKSMFLGQNKYIFGRFGGNMGKTNPSAQSEVLRIGLNTNTRVPTEVAAFWYGRWISGFEVEVEIEFDFG